MKRSGLVWWLMLLTSTAGCGRPALLKTPADTAARGQAAVETIKGDAGRAKIHIEKARTGTQASAREVRSAAGDAAAVPQAKPLAEQLTASADRLDREVVPELDQALARVEHVETATEDVRPLVTTVSDLAQERDRWQKEAAREAQRADKEKERADSAIRKWLLLVAAGGFAGILAGGALFFWLSRKTGLAVGLVSLAVFAVSVALYRWFEWVAWGGLALIGLAVAALGYGLWKNRHAFTTLVQGGQDAKDAFAEGVQYTKDQIRDRFNALHAAAQAEAGGGVQEMVLDVKDAMGKG